jgi:hypothetical protein
MHNNRFLKTMLVSVLLLCSMISFAHPGGHYHKGDGSVLNTWQLKTGEQVPGNFSMGNNDFIVLEQEAGVLVKIAFANLSVRDQQLARFKINRFQKLNSMYGNAPVNSNVTVTAWHYSNLLLSVLLAAVIILVLHGGLILFKKYQHTGSRMVTVAGSLALVMILTVACKKTATEITTTATTTTTTIPATTIAFLDAAFAPYKPAISTSSDITYYKVASDGIPAHNMMVGITNWQQQVPIPQFYTGNNSWSIPLQPVYATTPMSTKTNFMKGAVAIAVNGLPIFNALNNRGEDSYLIGELDNWGGHCGKADDYHYHAAPLHLQTTSGLMPIAFALDGFAVYGSKEPDGSTMQALDTCHGHTYNSGTYHYHGTSTYPYVIGAMKGKVTTDPATPAPENQILPQAFASPLRPATTPLTGASITAYSTTGTNAYKLTYKIGAAFGYIDYSWNATNLYSFVYTSTTGAVTTSTYQR